MFFFWIFDSSWLREWGPEKTAHDAEAGEEPGGGTRRPPCSLLSRRARRPRRGLS